MVLHVVMVVVAVMMSLINDGVDGCDDVSNK